MSLKHPEFDLPPLSIVLHRPPGLIRRRDPHVRVLPPGCFKLSPPRGLYVDGVVVLDKARPGFAAPFIPVQPEEWKPMPRLHWRRVRSAALAVAVVASPVVAIRYLSDCFAADTCPWSRPVEAWHPVTATAVGQLER